MYEVGQVVFVISDKHHRVLPVRVVEQVVRRTLDGETVEYRVQSDSSKADTYALSAIGASHFDSASSVRKYMYDNATSTIDEIVNAALIVAQSKYDYKESPSDFPPLSSDTMTLPADVFVGADSKPVPGVFKETETETKVKVQLPDGSYANVDLNGT